MSLSRRISVVVLATLALLVAAVQAQAQDGFTVTDCFSSGRGTGDLVDITDEGEAAGLYVTIVGLDRKPTTYILVLDGETWQVTDGATVVASGTVDTSDCGATTTTLPPSTTVPPDTTTTTDAPAPPPDTTRPPIDGCDAVECPTTTPPPQACDAQECPPQETTSTTEATQVPPPSPAPPSPGGPTAQAELPHTGITEQLIALAWLGGLVLLVGGGIVLAEQRIQGR